MSVTVQNLITLFDNYISDSTEDRVTNTQRYSYLTEATTDVKQQMKSALSNMTYQLKYIPGIHDYKINQGLFNVLAAGDIRVEDSSRGDIEVPLMISAPDKINEDITKGRYTNEYALDRYDKELYLTLSYMPVDAKKELSSMNSLDDITLLGDATASALDNNISMLGSSVKLTVDVSDSVDDLAGLKRTIDRNLTSLEGIGAVVGYVYIPDPTYITSVEVKLGTDDSNYYDFVATTPHNESAFQVGWNQVVINWADSTVTGSPDITDINQLETIVNYTSSQTDTTLHFDDFFISKPIDLRFHYISYAVGKDASGNEIVDFSAITDLPYFSGQYDNLKFVIARMAAALAFYDLRLFEEAQIHEFKAKAKLKEVRTLIPSNHRTESKSFRPAGVNFRRKRSL